MPQSLLDHPSADAARLRKAELRAEALGRRDALAPAARSAAADTIAARDLPVAIPAGAIVAGFMPFRTEISPLPLMRRLAQAGARLALPAIAGRGRPLFMRAWSFGDPLVAGQWGIREPAAEAATVSPTILLVPLAAFDRRGYRIGYGAGYYDMTLAGLRAEHPVTALGLAYAVQQIDEVPAMPHDEPLDFVLTEREIIACS